MAKYFYEGNLNEQENYHKKGQIEYYVRGTVKVNGRVYERYGIKTHFIDVYEDYIELIRQYVMPFIENGDILSISEKVISICQGNIKKMKDVHVSRFTKLISRFGKKTVSGIGITEPYKLQLMVDMNGWGKILFAGAVGLIGKVIGKRGVFYKILGEETSGIDGFYSHSAFEQYHNMAVLMPKETNKVCNQIYEKCGIPAMIVDANDISACILGKAEVLEEITDERLADYIADNPAGQDDELTPFIIIRDITGKTPQPYTPKKPKDITKS